MANLFSTTSSRQHELELHNPALCEELRIRDFLDSVGVMTNGTFVAAYELSGVHSYYHTEDMRNRAKESLEAVLRSSRHNCHAAEESKKGGVVLASLCDETYGIAGI